MRPSNFSIIQGTKNGLPGVLLVDLGLQPDIQSARYPWLLRISLTIGQPTAQGLCSSEESARLDAIEDHLLEALQESEYVYVGRVTWNGLREVLLYVELPEAVIDKFQAHFDLVGEEAIPIVEVYDPQWQEYRSLLP